MKLFVVACVLLGCSAALVEYRGPPECCKIMGSLDCTACKNGIPLENAEIRELPPDPKALHLPKAENRFNTSPRILKPRPRIISTEADDVTEGAPIACPQGSPNCYRPPVPEDCNHGSDGHFEGRFHMPGAVGCLTPGQNRGPILRPGGAYAPLYPAPYGLPHYPFPPDSQDWTRPALLTARDEGEVSLHEGEEMEKNEMPDKDGADAF